MYRCNCSSCIRDKRQNRVHFKVVPGLVSGPQKYLCATAIGKVANLPQQSTGGYIFLEEINHPRALENSIFISNRIYCISLLRM